VADLPTGFWGGWVVAITVVSLIGLAWLVWSAYFNRDHAFDAADEVWDETLREGTTPAPLWWFWLMVALLVITVVYLILYPGLGPYRGVLQWSQGGRVAESEARYEREFGAARRAIAEASVAELRDNPAALRSAQSVFQNNCAACHGPNASGQASLFPNLADDSWQWGGSDDALRQTITLGRQAVMTAWQAVLGDDGVDLVARYVFELSTGGPSLITSGGGPTFVMYCSACHGANGAGNQALGAPALNDRSWLYGGTGAAVRTSIREGRTGVMPAFGDRLDAAQINMLVAWLGRRRAD
jgi:cytochrome c oxidase cbb3-type subunit III